MEISVVIPLFNKEQTIVATIQSVLAQSFQPLEIVVVDDGSTDQSLEQVSGLKHPLIRLITQSNQGVSVARNTGIEFANAPWIAFLDGDDLWKPDFLKTVSELHENYNEALILATSYEFLYTNGVIAGIKLKKIPFATESGYLDNYFSVAASSHPPICSSAVCVKKTALQQIGGFPVDLKSGEDLLTWAKLAVDNKIAYSLRSEALYIHQASNEGSSFQREGGVDLVGKRLISLLNESNPANVKGLNHYIGRWLKSQALIFLELGDHRMAIKKSFESWQYSQEKIKLVIIVIFSFLPTKFVKIILRK
jgi:glycosyltransferase involved in cell wall biosynthesis